MKKNRVILSMLIAIMVLLVASAPVLANDFEEELKELTLEEKAKILEELAARKAGGMGEVPEKVLAEIPEKYRQGGLRLSTGYLEDFDSEGYGNGVVYNEFDMTVPFYGYSLVIYGYSETAWTGTTPQIYTDWSSTDRDFSVGPACGEADMHWTPPDGDPGDWEVIFDYTLNYYEKEEGEYTFCVIHDIDSEDPIILWWNPINPPYLPGASVTETDEGKHRFDSTSTTKTVNCYDWCIGA